MMSFKKRIDGYEIEVAHGYEYEKLQQLWLSVQLDQDLPFFLTWSWISCWLKTYDPEIVVVSAKWDNKVVAIGLFTRSVDSRHGFISSRQYRLHQMGDRLLDQIWMEYNDFIYLSDHRVSAVNACIQSLQQSDNEWDEIVLSMMAESRAREIMNVISNSHILFSSPCYSVDLNAIKRQNRSYLSTLNPNTRYQIRRSMRLYEQLHGNLKFELAQDTEQAIELFREAGRYHILRWDDSGYKNQKFIQFHENLIRNNFDRKMVAFMKVTAGDTTIAVIYFHLVNKNIFFYLQGLCYETDHKLKPGLVAHAMASQYYLEQGMNVYDYMGGYSQYKCQLATRSEDLVSICIQKRKLKFKIEKTGQQVKQLSYNVINRRSK
jgi:CelD/BcsL family acetyltransferase involved in cellulose biosynthesis